jgi:hypothetical protein
LHTLVIEDIPEVVVQAMLHFIASPWEDIADFFHYNTSQTSGPEVGINYWELHLRLMEASVKYLIPDLTIACVNGLERDDLFNGLDFMTRHDGLNSRTLMGEMLHQLFAQEDRACEKASKNKEGSRRGRFLDVITGLWVTAVDNVGSNQWLKVDQAIRGSGEAARQLQKNVRELYEAYPLSEDFHEETLESQKQEYEEVVMDEDGIWMLRMKSDALKIRSKL